jgi:KDO2-lipid IV(A) lauroyltransferase
LFAVISYYVALPFIYLLSLLPFRLLYLLSDVFFLFLYHVVGYRKKVVFQNLKNSFPEKSDAELNAISKSFYRYFCDLFLETFKTLTISRPSMLKHCSMDPAALALFERFAAAGQSLIIVMGHKGNWEWAGNTFSLCCRHQLYVIYHPLSNPPFNKLVVKMRTRFGTKLIVMKDTFRDMVQNRNELNATAFIADQAPSPDKAWWMSFLNQDTPVFMGTEKIALKMKYPIVYVSVKKIKRGYYTLTADTLKTPPYVTSEGEITEAHTQRLENDIIEQPETWLWTHRRWKHKRTTNLVTPE